MGAEPGTNAHGLVGARVVFACGRVAIALSSRNRGAVALTIVAAAVTLPLRCCHVVAVTPLLRCHRAAVEL